MGKVSEYFRSKAGDNARPEDNTPVYASDIVFGPQEEEEILSNCCGAEFGPPGYPDCDICSACGEHADPGEEENELSNPDDGSWVGR